MSNMTLPIPSICFIDANIIFYIEKLKSKDGFLTIIEQVYESVYIHEEVYKELSSAGQKFVDEKCDAKKWFTWGDSYELQIMDEGMEPLLVSLVVAIDCAKAAQGAAAGRGG